MNTLLTFLHDLATGLLWRGILLIILAGAGTGAFIAFLMYLIEKGNKNKKW